MALSLGEEPGGAAHMAQDTARDGTTDSGTADKSTEAAVCLWFPGLFGSGRQDTLSCPSVHRLDIGLPARMLRNADAPGHRPESLPLHPEQMAALANEFQLLAKESAKGSGVLNEAALGMECEREETRAREEREAFARLGETGENGPNGEAGGAAAGQEGPDAGLELARRRAQRTLLLLWLEERANCELDELIQKVEQGLSRLDAAFMADGRALPADAAPLENATDPLARWKTMLRNAFVLCPKESVFVLDVPVDAAVAADAADAAQAFEDAGSGAGAEGGAPAGIPDDLLALFLRAGFCSFAEGLARETGRAARGLEIDPCELFGAEAAASCPGSLRLVFFEGRA